MENEIKNLAALKGKTIIEVKNEGGELWLKFSDNTFAVMVVNDITESFGYTKTEVNLYKYGKDKTDHILVDFGLISENEYKLACHQEELEFKNRIAERVNAENERLKKYELWQLENLKTKYNK